MRERERRRMRRRWRGVVHTRSRCPVSSSRRLIAIGGCFPLFLPHVFHPYAARHRTICVRCSSRSLRPRPPPGVLTTGHGPSSPSRVRRYESDRVNQTNGGRRGRDRRTKFASVAPRVRRESVNPARSAPTVDESAGPSAGFFSCMLRTGYSDLSA